jgi:hypothetical protein
MVAAIAPVAVPSTNGKQIDAKVAWRLRLAAFPVFRPDATAFPGNGGSPRCDPATGEVVGVLNMAFVKSTKDAALGAAFGHQLQASRGFCSIRLTA